MTTQHGYISHSGASDFANAMTVGGGDGGEFVGQDGDGPLGIGSDFSGGDYSAAMAFLSFDTTAVVVTPATATLTLGDSFGESGDPTADIIVATYNWGTTVETADWRTPSQLAALTEVGRIAVATLPGGGSTFDIDIDPTAIAVAGTTRFVLFTESMAFPTTDPTGTEHVFVDGAADTNPPALNTTAPPPVVSTVTSISPARGNVGGGNTVTINGTGFATVTDVDFGGTPAASFVILDDVQIAAVSPAGTGSVDITVTTPGGTSATSAADLYGYDALDSPPDGPVPTYIRVVNIHGAAHTTSGLTDGRLPLATCESVTRTKNQPREAVITFPVYAYTRDDIHIFTDDTGSGELHEIQVIRGDRVLFWGPAITAEHDSDQGTVTLTCYDVMWYFMRRFLDAQRTNELTNPSFETGDTTGWTDEGAVTSSINSDAVRGNHSLELVSSTALGDIWEEQVVTITGTGIGTLVTFVFYFKIVGSLTGHAKDRRGLYVEARNTGGDLMTNNYYPIDEATPTGQWIRATTTIQVPPNTTWHLHVRLYSPPGTIRWDDGQAVAMQSISTATITGNTYEPIDVSEIVGLIHSFVQNTAFGKSDLNVDLDNPTVGVKQVKHIQWADHISWPDQMSEWLDRDDCFDISIRAEIGPPSRTLVLHIPEQGTDRRGVTAIAYPGNAAHVHFSEDGGGTVTDDTELDTDTGNGPDREEGHHADASLIDGLVLQAVNSAPTNTDPAGLDPIATDAVHKARRPAVLVTFLLTNKDGVAYDDLLELNDTMDFSIDRGWVSMSGVFGKITTMKEMPPSRTTEITMVRAEPG